jgi:hypothetical protein
VTSTSNAAAANSTAATGSGNSAIYATLPNGVNGAAPVVNGQSASQTVSAVSARDNAQLADSQSAQNTARQTSNGNTDAQRARLEAQMGNAPSDTPNAASRNSPVFGQPTTRTDSALNPANQGPVPGGNVAGQNGTLGNGPRSQSNVQSFFVLTPTAGYTVTFSPGSNQPTGQASPASTQTSSARASNQAGTPNTAAGGGNVTGGNVTGAASAAQTSNATRIKSYGPTSSGQSTLRTEQANGTFQFSDQRKKRERQATR